MNKDEIIKNQIRNVLINLRTERKLTQTDIGKLVGKSKTAVASWEQGLSMPDVVTLYELSKFYGKDLNYMYGVDDYLLTFEHDGKEYHGMIEMMPKPKRKEDDT